MHRAVGRNRKRGIAVAAPDRLKAKLDRSAARSAGGRERNRQPLGAELVGEVIGYRAVEEKLVPLGMPAVCRHLERGLWRIGLGGIGFGRKRAALRPFHFDGRDGAEQRAGEISLRADAGLRNRLFDRERAEALREFGRADRLVEQEIDGAGDRGLQVIERKAVDAVDAGDAGSEFLPVVFLALTERAHDAHAGYDDDGTARRILESVVRHDSLARSLRRYRRLRRANGRRSK